MPYKDLPDNILAQKYLDGIPVPVMEKEYKTTHTTIYRHLKRYGITFNRKVSIPWTPEEDQTVIDGSNLGLSAGALELHLPGRTFTAIKSRIRKFRDERRIKEVWV